MRLLVTSAGLAAMFTSVARANWAGETGTIAENYFINFTYTDTNWSSSRIFDNSLSLAWTKFSYIQITNASLWKYDIENQNGSIIYSPAESTPVPTSTGGGGHPPRRRRNVGDVSFTQDLNPSTSGSVTVSTASDGTGADLDTPLYLQLTWENNNDMSKGSSYSRYFAMIDGEENGNTETSNFLVGSSTTAAYPECNGDACSTSLPSASSTSTSQTVSSSTSTASSGANQAAASSSSNGLSTGAIAGIAVACGIVGLALISAAIWFLCCFNRRQRRNGTGHSALAQHHQQNGSYVSDGMARGMRSDKELPHVTDSPQSAFAPNRGLRDSMSSTAMGMGVGAGAGAGAAAGLMTPVGSGNEQQQQQQQQQQPMNVHHQHQHASVVMSDDGDESTYTPYRDHTPPPTNLYAHHDASTSSQTSLPASLPPHARSPTPPISSRYAHLVEEGMTDEEIRRLEEEERALDVAIEDAGRSSRAQSYTQGRASGGGGR